MSGCSRYFTQLGGRPTITRVIHLLYDRIYAHAWLKQFFVNTTREHQERQQTDFMVSVFGGPPDYSGRVPRDAHPHLFITDEVFDIRHTMLKDALSEAGVPDDLADTWLNRDERFRPLLVKRSIDECKGRYGTDRIIAPSRPT